MPVMLYVLANFSIKLLMLATSKESSHHITKERGYTMSFQILIRTVRENLWSCTQEHKYIPRYDIHIFKHKTSE